MSIFSDNPFQPRMVTDAYVPDQLIAGQFQLVTETVTITGGAFKRGTVMGRINVGSATAAPKTGGNTGNGTISAITRGAGAKVGVYTLRMTGATTFKLEDPDGFVIESQGATGAAFLDDIGFTVTVGATPFAAGDGFDITVAAGTGTWTAATAAATDGSATPRAILVDDVDASAADVRGGIYRSGQFNTGALTLGAGTTLAAVRAAFAGTPLFLSDPVSAADPS